MPVLLLASLAADAAAVRAGAGRRALGARRWFGLFGLTFQPAEAAKAVLVLYLASYFGRRGETPLMADLVPPLVVTLVFAALVYAQNDYSTAVFVAVLGLALCFAAGARALTLAALGLFALPLGFLLALHPRAPRGAPAHLPRHLRRPGGQRVADRQLARRAGRRRLLGHGARSGRGQARRAARGALRLHLLGDRRGDRPRGHAVVLALFAVFAWRGFSLAAKADDRFASLAAYGITLTIVLQALLNMAVAVGLVPTTGVTLPFFSAGGSSMLVTLALCGVLVNVSRGARRGAGAGRRAGRPVHV